MSTIPNSADGGSGKTRSRTLHWPPGRAGGIARYIYHSSYSPIQEVATSAALALLAGVCGRAYRTHTNKDLALYIILVAKSGTGKDAIHEGIPAMIALAERPLAEHFVRSQDFVSGEALHKEVLRGPGFLNLQGEVGRKLKRMACPKDTPMQTFRTLMTNAYGKRYLEGKSYSRAEDSLPGVEWPALSFLGETTPNTYFECLTPDMMADGFLSRFLVISYQGDRPLPNRNRHAFLEDEDLAHWKDLVNKAVGYQLPINTPAACQVGVSPDALEKLDSFELSCIADLNATDDETERQVWTRAHLKVLKVASLLAVADHYLNPLIDIGHVAWALTLVRQDIAVFQSRKSQGDIGTDDNARERKLIAFMKEYSLRAPPASYKVPAGMQENNIVPRSYLQIRAQSLPAFTNHRQGTKRALEDVIASCIANGYLMEVQQSQLVEHYSFFGKAYRMIKLP